jgi:hypothetical protein
VSKTKPITDYANPDSLRLLAAPANIKLGEEIAKSGGKEEAILQTLRGSATGYPA